MTIEELRASSWIIYEIQAGSKLYNIMDENSDIDIRGIYNVPLYNYLCNHHPTKIVVNNENEDVLFMEIVTYLNLACAGNPNVIDWLFSKNAIKSSKSLEMQDLIVERDVFVTKTFMKKSLAMAASMIDRCKKKKELQWKMLAHSYRLITNIQNLLNGTYHMYTPILEGNDKDVALSLKQANDKWDYWEMVSTLEFAIKAWDIKVEATDLFPETVSDDFKDNLILKFKTKYYGIEAVEREDR